MYKKSNICVLAFAIHTKKKKTSYRFLNKVMYLQHSAVNLFKLKNEFGIKSEVIKSTQACFHSCQLAVQKFNLSRSFYTITNFSFRRVYS